MLRRAVAQDIPAIARIEQACFGNPWAPDAYFEELGRLHGVLEVLAEGEVVIGFSCCWHIVGEAHLLRLATDPEYRRQGGGRQLLQAVLFRAASVGCSEVTLEVGASNTAAVALYRLFGFEEVGRRRGYYRTPPDDAILMRCPIVGAFG